MGWRGHTGRDRRGQQGWVGDNTQGGVRGDIQEG